MPDQQRPTRRLRSGKAYSLPVPTITLSHAAPKEKTRSPAQIAATKRALQIRLEKKQRKAAAITKRQAFLRAAAKAKLAQIAVPQAAAVASWQRHPLGKPQPIRVQEFARPWVDETIGESVGLDEIERSEIEEIVRRANSSAATILKIQRVHNEFLERPFWEKREEFRKKEAAEQIIMFHGTHQDNIVS